MSVEDTNYTIKEYGREHWTLADLRTIVDDTTGWVGTTPVLLTAPQSKCAHGTIEVVGTE